MPTLLLTTSPSQSGRGADNMAVSNEHIAVTYLAGEDIPLGYAVMMSTAADKTVLKATSGEKAVGVCMMAVTSGNACPVVVAGRVKVRTMEAVTRGDDLKVHTDGRFGVATAGGTHEVLLRAEESASGADIYISALFAPRPAAVP